MLTVDAVRGVDLEVAEGELTHGIEAARQLAAGDGLVHVGSLIAAEALVGCLWGLCGYGLLRYFEHQSFMHATLDRA